VWVEVTTLVIPDLNDGREELRHIARFVEKIAPEIPWHVTWFYPAYKYTDRPPTPVTVLRQACEIGLEEGLRYVYEGIMFQEKGVKIPIAMFAEPCSLNAVACRCCEID
jgi:pyruvate formate lyase activating enzyme